jgi:hypothetical protein
MIIPIIYYYYGSADRNRAMALETLLLLGQSKKSSGNKIGQNMSSDQWMSTQTGVWIVCNG